MIMGILGFPREKNSKNAPKEGFKTEALFKAKSWFATMMNK